MIILEIVPKGKEPQIPKDSTVLTAEGQPLPPRSYFIKKVPGRLFETSIIYPGDPAETSASRSRFAANGKVEDVPLTLEEAKEAQNGNTYLAVWGEVWYSDIFGTDHWTKFCRCANYGGALTEGEKCAKFSSVDSN